MIALTTQDIVLKDTCQPSWQKAAVASQIRTSLKDLSSYHSCTVSDVSQNSQGCFCESYRTSIITAINYASYKDYSESDRSILDFSEGRSRLRGQPQCYYANVPSYTTTSCLFPVTPVTLSWHSILLFCMTMTPICHSRHCSADLWSAQKNDGEWQ